jgi:hypothetical protein
MATVTKSYNVGKILQTPVDVWFSVAAPPSSATPTSDANTLTLTATLPVRPTDTGAAGFHGGFNEGPVIATITEKINEIEADNFENAIDAGLASVMFEIDLKLKQTEDLAHLLTYLTASNLGAYNALAAQNVIQLGGKQDSTINPITVLLTAPRRDATGKNIYVMGYNMFLENAPKYSYARAKEALVELKFIGIPDFTRVTGDELGQIVRDQ